MQTDGLQSLLTSVGGTLQTIIDDKGAGNAQHAIVLCGAKGDDIALFAQEWSQRQNSAPQLRKGKTGNFVSRYLRTTVVCMSRVL